MGTVEQSYVDFFLTVCLFFFYLIWDINRKKSTPTVSESEILAEKEIYAVCNCRSKLFC